LQGSTLMELGKAQALEVRWLSALVRAHGETEGPQPITECELVRNKHVVVVWPGCLVMFRLGCLVVVRRGCLVMFRLGRLRQPEQGNIQSLVVLEAFDGRCPQLKVPAICRTLYLLIAQPLEDMRAGRHNTGRDEKACRLPSPIFDRNPQRHRRGFEQLLTAQGLPHSSPTVNVDFALALPMTATNPPDSTANSQPNSTLTPICPGVLQLRSHLPGHRGQVTQQHLQRRPPGHDFLLPFTSHRLPGTIRPDRKHDRMAIHVDWNQDFAIFRQHGYIIPSIHPASSR
jgi:hypothetical protein